MSPDTPEVDPNISPSYRDGAPSDYDLARYVAQMCAELRDLARRPRFRTVVYLLDMAGLEAQRVAKDLED